MIVYIIDTGYVHELYGTPGWSTPHGTTAVRQRFADAIGAGATLVVPVGVIYEVANHLAQGKQATLAAQLAEDVRTAITDRQPWLISPAENQTELMVMLDTFAREYVRQGVGLVDLQVCELANRWKKKGRHYRVHIWTLDRALKAREPDSERRPHL